MPALDDSNSNESSMGDSCSKESSAIVSTNGGNKLSDRNGGGVVVKGQALPGGSDDAAPALPQQQAFAQPTMVNLPPPPPSAGIKRKRNNKAGPVKQSLWRVGSRVLSRGKDQSSPDSPTARASNYNHVHNMVAINFQEAASDRAPSDAGADPMGVVGLRNQGNTCFMNSALQCLSSTIPLTDYFLGYDYRKEINRDNFLGTGGKLVTAYAELMKCMWLGTNGTGNSNGRTTSNSLVVHPVAFKQALERFAPQFKGTYQHDAQELLSFLLDGIHEDLNRVTKKPYIEDKDCDGSQDEKDAMEAWENYLRRDKSLIVDIFQGQLKSTLTCLTCGHSNIRFEPFMYLSLPVSESCRTLDDCLELYLAQDTLTGANQWYCSKCKQHVDATKKTDLWILPPILICHLKRFKVNAFGQLASKQALPIAYDITEWDLSSSVSRKRGERPVYDLYAVSNHVGGLGGGHYTAYSLNRFNDEWYEFNDSSYRQVSPSELERDSSRSSAYLLFYNRSRTDRQGGTPDGRAPMIRRQSVSRPDQWPHNQVENHQFRSFARITSASNTPTTPGRNVASRSPGRFSAKALASLAPPWLGGSTKPPPTTSTAGTEGTKASKPRALSGVQEEEEDVSVFLDAEQQHTVTQDEKEG